MTQTSARTKRPPGRAAAALYLGILLLCACCLCPAARAQTAQPPVQPDATRHAPAHPLHRLELMARREVVSITVPDLAMTDQGGRKVRLYSDIMSGKLVILNFFYTTCKGVCPTTGVWLSKLQDQIGERLGKDVAIVSISLDPEVDTPERIGQWAARWRRRPGWTLLTSKDEAARKLADAFLAGGLGGGHSPVVFVGDGRLNPVGWIGVDVLDESLTLPLFFDLTKEGSGR